MTITTSFIDEKNYKIRRVIGWLGFASFSPFFSYRSRDLFSFPKASKAFLRILIPWCAIKSGRLRIRYFLLLIIVLYFSPLFLPSSKSFDSFFPHINPLMYDKVWEIANLLFCNVNYYIIHCERMATTASRNTDKNRYNNVHRLTNIKYFQFLATPRKPTLQYFSKTDYS